MKPVTKLLSELADNVFMTLDELAAKLDLSDLDQSQKLAILGQDNKKLNMILSDKEIKSIKDRANATSAAVTL